MACGSIIYYLCILSLKPHVSKLLNLKKKKGNRSWLIADFILSLYCADCIFKSIDQKLEKNKQNPLELFAVCCFVSSRHMEIFFWAAYIFKRHKQFRKRATTATTTTTEIRKNNKTSANFFRFTFKHNIHTF